MFSCVRRQLHDESCILAAPSAGDSCDASTSAPQFEEDAHFILGKSLLDCQEYLRASHVLSRAKRTPTSVFLRHYATYLHLTRSFGVASPASVPTPAGRRLMEGLRALLRDVLHDMGFTTAEAAAKGTAYPWGKRDGSPGDPFLAYLAGMVLSDLQQRDLARSALGELMLC